MIMKRFLLGSVAAVVAATGVQAADLPVAEPVDYVRVCDIYGNGFFFIPGTETCLRISGYVRTELRLAGGDGRLSDRGDGSLEFRARGRLNYDARSETEFGTLRSFIRVEVTDDNDEVDTDLERAFIQWGGFTAGLATSFFDFYTGNGISVDTGARTADETLLLFAYTLNFGAGFELSLAVENGVDRQNDLSVGAGAALGVVGGPVGGTAADFNRGGLTIPDFVAALRVDQSWGLFQVMGAIHHLRPNFRAISGGPTIDDEFGWAVAAGAEIDLPFLDGTLSGQVAYADGAGAYAGLGNSELNPVAFDAVLLPNGELSTVNVLGVGGSLLFSLTDDIEFSIDGNYIDVDYAGAAIATLPAAVADWESWNVIGTLYYEPVDDLTFAVGVAYEETDVSSVTIEDEELVEFVFRMQRDF